MTPDEWRLIIEASVVTVGFIGLVALAAWHIVQTRDNEPGAIDSLVASNNELARRVRVLEKSEVANHESLLRLHTRLELQTAYSRALAEYSRAQANYSATLADRLRQLGQDVPPAPGNPPTPPPELEYPLTPPAVNSDNVITTLPAILASLFNNEELTALADELNVPDGTLGGETAMRRSRELVEFMRRRNRISELVATARRLRPDGGL